MTNIKEQTIPTAYSREVNVDLTLKYTGEMITLLAKGTETNGRFAFMEVKVRSGTHSCMWSCPRAALPLSPCRRPSKLLIRFKQF
jgi:hypothetical protein